MSLWACGHGSLTEDDVLALLEGKGAEPARLGSARHDKIYIVNKVGNNWHFSKTSFLLQRATGVLAALQSMLVIFNSTNIYTITARHGYNSQRFASGKHNNTETDTISQRHCEATSRVCPRLLVVTSGEQQQRHGSAVRYQSHGRNCKATRMGHDCYSGDIRRLDLLVDFPSTLQPNEKAKLTGSRFNCFLICQTFCMGNTDTFILHGDNQDPSNPSKEFSARLNANLA